MTSMTQNPLDAFIKQIDTFRVQFQGDAKDWELIYQYLLMPLFDTGNSLSRLLWCGFGKNSPLDFC